MSADEARRRFPSRLRQAAAIKCYNQTTLAHEIGVDRKTVHTWWTGQCMPIGDQIAALSEVLDVSADWLLGAK